MNLFERLADVQERWNVLRHPFYTRWERGELTVDELAFYAGEYRHAVVALADQAEAAGAEHAAEEARHIGLWDDFARALDADLEREPRPETLECVEPWTGGDDRLERLAVMYAVESAQPAISRTKLAGLAEHYGFEADAPGRPLLRTPRGARLRARRGEPSGPRRRGDRGRCRASRRGGRSRATRELASVGRGGSSGLSLGFDLDET